MFIQFSGQILTQKGIGERCTCINYFHTRASLTIREMRLVRTHKICCGVADCYPGINRYPGDKKYSNQYILSLSALWSQMVHHKYTLRRCTHDELRFTSHCLQPNSPPREKSVKCRRLSAIRNALCSTEGFLDSSWKNVVFLQSGIGFKKIRSVNLC